MRQELRGTAISAVSAALFGRSWSGIWRRGSRASCFSTAGAAAAMLLLSASAARCPSAPGAACHLTYHSANGRLMCHYCGHSEPAPETCPDCGGAHEAYRRRHPEGGGGADAALSRHGASADGCRYRRRQGHEKLLREFQTQPHPHPAGDPDGGQGTGFCRM